MWPFEGLGFLLVSFLTLLLITQEALKREGKVVSETVSGFGEWHPCEQKGAHVGGTVSVPWWFSVGPRRGTESPAPVVLPLNTRGRLRFGEGCLTPHWVNVRYLCRYLGSGFAFAPFRPQGDAFLPLVLSETRTLLHISLP